MAERHPTPGERPMFVPGQRVVCVDEIHYKSMGPKFRAPEKGKSYTVREYPVWVDGGMKGQRSDISIVLVEIKNPPFCECSLDGTGGRNEPAFWQGHFAPVQDTDISVFENIRTELEARHRVKEKA